MLRGATRMALSCLTLLGAMLPVACVYEQIPEAYDEADTYIHLNLISSETNTRGVSDEHQGTVDENTITSLRVWAFDADSKSVGGTALCYKEETALNATTGLHTFTMKLPRMTGGRPLKKIDLYILANAESGSNLATPAENRQLTRQELQEKVVSESFGLNAQGDPQCVVVPAGGLPMSRIVQDIPIEGYVIDFKVTPDKEPTINCTELIAKSVSRIFIIFTPADKKLDTVIPASTIVMRELSETYANTNINNDVNNAPTKDITGCKNRLCGNNAIESITKKPAPELTPIVLGLASELFITSCNMIPATASPEPAKSPAITRGSLTILIITAVLETVSLPVRAANISLKPTLTLPKASPSIKDTSSATERINIYIFSFALFFSFFILQTLIR